MSTSTVCVPVEGAECGLKRAKMYAAPGTSLDEIIRAYCAERVSHTYLK